LKVFKSKLYFNPKPKINKGQKIEKKRKKKTAANWANPGQKAQASPAD
jgi:hypothetical protein